MKMFNRIIILIIFSVFLSPTPQLHSKNPVGFEFLRTFVGARPAAMAGAFIAVPGDIHNIVYNPAGLAALSERQGTVSYLNHLLDFQSGFMAYAQPLYNGTIALGLNFMNYGQFERMDDTGIKLGEFGANSFVFAVSYSQMIKQGLSLGASGKYIRFQIDDLTETAVAADVGINYSIESHKLNIGFGIFNFGKTTSAFVQTKDELPLNFQLGASKELEHLPLFVSGALVLYKGESLDFRLGGEFTLSEPLLLRFGYNSVGQEQKVDTGKDNLAGFSIGLGFKLSTLNFDYSFSSFGEVGALNRITIVGRL